MLECVCVGGGGSRDKCGWYIVLFAFFAESLSWRDMWVFITKKGGKVPPTQ